MDDVTPTSGQPEGSAWEQMLRQMFGPEADEALRQMRAQGLDPAQMAAASGLPNDPAALQQMIGQVQRMLASSGDGPVNWDVAHDAARQIAVTGGDPVLSAQQTREVTDALSVAELWLDAATDLPPSGGTARALSRSEWVEQTLPTWRALTEPVATSMSTALAETLSSQLPESMELPPGLPGGFDPQTMMRQLGSLVFGMQVGQAAGSLAREVFGLTDVGLPLVHSPATALVPGNVADFAEGLEIPLEEVRLFLAVREAAHARLFTHVGWLRAHLLGAVDAYARGISIDLESLEESVRQIDPTDPQALQGALSSGVFAPQNTPEQQAVLGRLETALALVEGWVDEVTAAATLPHLPHTVQLREMIRRRRAAGGPAEQTFATLVGLELRPRRSRDAAALWALISRESGPQGRDAVWDHPDLLPTAEDLDDPAGYQGRRRAAQDEHADLDRALAEILGEDDEQQD
ncbi:zinc-dependent metalloprotease [Cellulomonas denverensis]|uniref:Zinc-dependent metalloprotease n=1 Tax=Cellulomonas denverensis TaxID=264297 RepID=A0A7X6QYR2_9CELL|nr:zinc-dependent metalloprotease [Cellulomonas denverensis]NKY22402.1 zinc-dependent metalloprotease [Cellulomonas denverensis]GIG26326.1 hydrolase [Cellulomonas denverensis]